MYSIIYMQKNVDDDADDDTVQIDYNKPNLVSDGHAPQIVSVTIFYNNNIRKQIQFARVRDNK